MRSLTPAPYLNRLAGRALSRCALPVAFAAMACCGSASAASMFYIRGGGDGHGIGMSQWGALGYAMHGKDYRFILGHYYQGTSIGATDANQIVRVLLATGSAPFSGATRAGSTRLKPATTYYVKALADGDLKIVTAAGKRVGHPSAAPLTATGPGPLQVPALGSYQGSLEFRPDGAGGVETVNAVGLDDYVEGVVPSEVPSSWPMQALEAQAVAARTYAITTSVSGDGFNLYSDTRSQMYGGVNAETPATNAAVGATSGQIVTYSGQPAVTYFFASSGGYTESIQNVWPGSTPEPWLRGVPDPYDSAGGDPYHSWGSELSLAAATRTLGPLVQGRLLGIVVTRHGVSPRILEADVVGTRGRSSVSGAALQRIFGLSTTYAAFTTISTSASANLLTGTIFPQPRHGTVSVQTWAAGSWHMIGHITLGRAGSYRARIVRPGRYQITYGKLRGPVYTASYQPIPAKVARRMSVALQSLGGALPAWVNVYAGADVWPTARDRRPVRPVSLVLRPAGLDHRGSGASHQRAARRH